MRQGKYIQCSVKESTDLLTFLQKSLYGISRTKAKNILKGGGVMVNKNVVTSFDFKVTPGMIVEISRRKPEGAVNSKFLRIIYEDHDIIVIDKQPGILSSPSSQRSISVKSILDDHLRRSHQKCTSHVIHRLDRETSGLMIYAKNIETAKTMEDDWKKYVFDRRYVALTDGIFEKKKGLIESWLTENRDFRVWSSPSDNGGKYSLTHFNVISSGNNHSLVDLKLDTGRKNQIRVHMYDIGHPVSGDKKYESKTDPCGRLCLHAYRLCFLHPRTNEVMEYETPIPENFISALHLTK